MNVLPSAQTPRGRLAECVEVVLHAGMSAVLSGFAVLKEEPMFWRNAGGWPVWFRDVVKFTFHPLVVFQLIALTLLSIRLLRFRRFSTEKLLVLLALWILAAVPIVLSIADNFLEFVQSI